MTAEQLPMNPQDPGTLLQPFMDDGRTPRCQGHSTQHGGQCRRPANHGTTVCNSHGGRAPQVRRKAALRLAELVDPAIATLAREMATAEKSNDRQAAANSILDRAGIARRTEVASDDVHATLIEKVEEALALEQQADGSYAITEISDTDVSAGPLPVRGDSDRPETVAGPADTQE